MTRCGVVAVLGAPNVGKSTLVNALVGAKVSIVSPKVQTTRTRVRGIMMQGETQVILTDTPGIFVPQRRLDRAMVAAAWTGAADADVALLLIDAARGLDKATRRVLADLHKVAVPLLLVLNKVDAVKRDALLPLAAELAKAHDFQATFMVSALTEDGLQSLAADLASRMLEGPWLFPEDDLSDMPMRLLAAEVTREKLYLMLRQELPYDAVVETDTWDEQADGSARIAQTITVARDGQKAIVLGKQGQMIKRIGIAAREELSVMLERTVHLSLFVKVREHWGDDREHYAPWGLDYDA